MVWMLPAAGKKRRRTFHLWLIKPSHYDDDGYVIQWARNEVPSNSLAVLYGLAIDCAGRNVLGEDVDFSIPVQDETNCRIRTTKIVRRITGSGERGLVALVGGQANQFPRAMDVPRPFAAAGIPVGSAGFHAAGSLAMLPEPPPEIRAAWALGVSIFAGEGEGRMEELLRDADRGTLKPLYNRDNELPGLEGVPTPILPRETIRRHLIPRTSFDAGRGCPFQCSFCTIINVQGR